jgi:hypothetical protein
MSLVVNAGGQWLVGTTGFGVESRARVILASDLSVFSRR